MTTTTLKTKMKTPSEIAAVFGCTPEQAKTQQLANAAQLREMAAKARATGKKVNGYTAAELDARAEAIGQAAK